MEEARNPYKVFAEIYLRKKPIITLRVGGRIIFKLS